MNEPPATLPWWKSRVIVGALVSAICKLLFALGAVAAVAPDEEAAIADALLLVISIVGDAVVVQARLSQKFAPPITAGRSAAEG